MLHSGKRTAGRGPDICVGVRRRTHPMYLFSRVSCVSAVVPIWLAPLVVAGAVAVMGCTTPRGSADRAEDRDADGDEATADQSALVTDTAAPGVAAEDHSAAWKPGTQATARV